VDKGVGGIVPGYDECTTRVDGDPSYWIETVGGVLQGSILTIQP